MKKLSIVIPTKNRFEYLEHCLKSLLKFESENFEVIIQDNSDSIDEMTEFLKALNDERVVYSHHSGHLSVIENCNLGISRATGKYLTLLGDDDGILDDIIPVVDWMERMGFDTLVSNKPSYIWPDIDRKSDGLTINLSGKLMLSNFSNTYSRIETEKERRKVFDLGATSILQLPKLYHGIVSRDILEKIHQKTNSYFPGPSPDMSNAIAVSVFAKSTVFLDYPLFISGKSAKSTSGLGLSKKHNGEIRNQKFLPEKTADNWEIRIPFFWSGQTIWAESAIKSICAVGKNEEIENFNFEYLYSELYIYEFYWRNRINEKVKLTVVNLFKICSYIILILLKRTKTYISNFIKYRLNIGANLNKNESINNIGNCVDFIKNSVVPKSKIWEKS